MKLLRILIPLFSVLLFSAFYLINDNPRILVYTKNGEGYVHENIPNSIKAIKALGEKNGFDVEASEDPSVFNTSNLSRFDALVFSNTNNEVFDTEDQKKAFVEYIQSGGGFVGIHSATGTERDWPWFHKLIGGKFERHAPFQEFTAKVIDKDHPSTVLIPTHWVRTDEAYYFKKMNPSMHVLVVHDMTTVEDPKKSEYPSDIFADEFPSVWTNNFEGSRQWYTSYGHTIEHYDDPVFRQHILGGILWVMNK